ncbi:MAG: hypothetical protein H6Q23_2074 [Bacteroidetes bacterium]|nr:hypothetical protein [Bacteroidota bacterium]
METKDCRFLSSVLSARTRKYTPHFANKSSLCPEPPCRIEKLAHLSAHISKACRRSEDNRIGRGKLIEGTYRYGGKALLRIQGGSCGI